MIAMRRCGSTGNRVIDDPVILSALDAIPENMEINDGCVAPRSEW